MEVSDYTSQPQPRRQKTKSYTDQEWDKIKPHFCELYATKGWTLKQTKRAMAERHQFFASYEASFDLEVHLPELTVENSDKMYKTRIKRWNLRKYNQDRESLHVIRKANEAAEKGNSVVFRVNGRLVTPEEAKKHFVRKGIDYEQALAHRRFCSPTPSAVEVADQSQNETPESDQVDGSINVDCVANQVFLNSIDTCSNLEPLEEPKSFWEWPDPMVDWSTLDQSSWLDPYLAIEEPPQIQAEVPSHSPWLSVSTVCCLQETFRYTTSTFERPFQRRDWPSISAEVPSQRFGRASDEDTHVTRRPSSPPREHLYQPICEAIEDLAQRMDSKLRLVGSETRRRNGH